MGPAPWSAIQPLPVGPAVPPACPEPSLGSETLGCLFPGDVWVSPADVWVSPGDVQVFPGDVSKLSSANGFLRGSLGGRSWASGCPGAVVVPPSGASPHAGHASWSWGVVGMRVSRIRSQHPAGATSLPAAADTAVAASTSMGDNLPPNLHRSTKYPNPTHFLVQARRRSMALAQGTKIPAAGCCSMSPGHMGRCFLGPPPAAGGRGDKAPSSTPNNPGRFPRAPTLGEQLPRAGGKFQGDSLSPSPLQ